MSINFHNIIIKILISGFLFTGFLFAEIQFNEQIRPILSKNCTGCHGGVKAEGGFSFIYRDQALGQGDSGAFVIVPGSPEASEMVRRINLPANDIERMPHRSHGAPLKKHEIELLEQWISQGAKWQEHWAFSRPVKSEVPKIESDQWSRNDIDKFILKKLSQKKMLPNADASKEEWLRRVSFDLIGLPPTPNEIKDFLNDESDKAYEKVVDRLLSDSAYGERWASVWLDLARYSDTKGYEKDKERIVYPYRDWVIKAFNSDMSYSDFTVKQLAGDLLEKPEFDDYLATTFHRLTQNNDEGGTNDEEFRVLSTMDRTSTTWTAWNGFTMMCTQCHDHPYDPVTHEEYYGFMDYFNNNADADTMADTPHLRVPHDESLRTKIAQTQKNLINIQESLGEAGAEYINSHTWEKAQASNFKSNKPGVDFDIKNHEQGSLFSLQGNAVMRAEYSFDIATEKTIHALKFTSHMLPETNAADPSPAFFVNAFNLEIHKGKEIRKLPNVRLIVDYIDPYMQTLQWGAFPNQFKETSVMLQVSEPIELKEGEVLHVKIKQNKGRSGSDPPVLRLFSLQISSNDNTQTNLYKQVVANINNYNASKAILRKTKGVDVPFIHERKSHLREQRRFARGVWTDKKEVVEAQLPKVLFEKSESIEAPTRLEMANWITSDKNPLASRVWVNRIWATLFGRGIVPTLGDFGSTGIPPSHPKLLDNLALDMEQKFNWKLKPFLKEVVLSSTYRQSNKITEEVYQKDPNNVWLARGPRNRLSSEMVRDSALASAGILSRKMYGEPVMPPQPEGIWQAPYNDKKAKKWETSPGEDAYRRALYVYWRRSSPYPSFEVFDTPERKVCSPSRIPTNTPLQALVTLNDPVYYEASENLAKLMVQHSADKLEQLKYGFLRSTSRFPTQKELEILSSLYSETIKEDSQKLPVLVANTILNLDASLTK